MKYTIIPPGELEGDFTITLFVEGKKYAAPMPMRGEAEQLKDGLLGMVKFINERQTALHDKQAMGEYAKSEMPGKLLPVEGKHGA